MKVTVKMHVDLLTVARGIYYKYVVFSRQMCEPGHHPYEYLHGAPRGTGHTNRALKVPSSKCTPGG